MTVNVSSVLSLIPPCERLEMTSQSQTPEFLAQNLHQLKHISDFIAACATSLPPPTQPSPARPAQARNSPCWQG